MEDARREGRVRAAPQDRVGQVLRAAGAAGGGGVMENLLQNFASGLWIVLGVYCFFGLRKWNKRFSELYDELKWEVE